MNASQFFPLYFPYHFKILCKFTYLVNGKSNKDILRWRAEEIYFFSKGDNAQTGGKTSNTLHITDLQN